MQLDSFTILAAGCSLLVLQGAVFLFLWWRDRSSTALLWWAGPFISGGAALTFYMQPNWDSDLLAIVIGNAARIFSLACLWQGIRVFSHRPSALPAILALCLLWAGLCLVPVIFSSMTARIAIVSLMNSLLCGLAAFELWRGRAERLSSRRPLVVVFASFAALMFIRAIISGIAPFPVGSQPIDSVWLAVFMWLVFGHATFAAILFLTMLMERREAEQRNFAMSDPLTGLLNRRAFADFAARMNRRRTGLRSAMALLVLDLDHFKSVNDRFGHEVGDRMLKAFAEVAEANVRPADQLFRMGGEEFCFAFTDSTLAEAVAVAERIRAAFSVTVIDTASGPAAATVSIGIAATQFAIDVDVLLAAADAAVYEAKARGRNRVVVAEPSSLARMTAGAADTGTRRRA